MKYQSSTRSCSLSSPEFPADRHSQAALLAACLPSGRRQVKPLVRRRRDESFETPSAALRRKQVRELALEAVVHRIWPCSQRVERLAGETAHRCRQRNVENVEGFDAE